MIAIEACRAGQLSPQVALARLMLAGLGPAAMIEALDAAPPGPAIDAMRALAVARFAGLQTLFVEIGATIAGHDTAAGGPAENAARIAAYFDRAVEHSPEASVALYSLGDPAILATATAEVVDWLRARGVLGPETDVLDLGCGIGRVAAALAPACRFVLGLDVSPGMVAEAARRLADHPNVRIRHTAGEGLDALPSDGFDLVLAVDSFPYIVQMGDGTALAHVCSAARILRPGGALCILNLSYRGDDAMDRADAARWAQVAGLRMVEAGERPFGLWDGAAYLFRR